MKTLFLTILIIVAGFAQLLGQNNAPVALPDSIDVMEQVPVLIDVKANDYDPDGDQIFIGSVNPSFGVAYKSNEMIYFKSTVTSTDRIRYTIKDDQTPQLYSPAALVKINVLFNPDVPIAVADTFELMKLLPHNIDLVANDYDANGDVIKIREIKSPINCAVHINPDSISVTITSGLTPSSTFDYYIQESNTETNYRSRQVKVRILNSPNPDIPVINPDTAYTTGGFNVTIPVLENDMDPQGDQIEIKSFTQPGHGTVEKTGESLLYLPDLSYAGEDEFQYSVRETNEPGIYTDNAIVKLFVSKNPECPVAMPDIASGTTAIPLIIDVLSNDYDINNDVLVLKDVSSGTITADNKILFQSSPLSLVKDSITYRVMEANNNSSFSEWAKVNIQLAVNPDLPVTVNDYVTTHAGVPIRIRPLINDIKNAEDTLILRFAFVSSGINRQGIAYPSMDTVVYVPAFQAKGTEVIDYYIRGGESNNPLAMGKIYVNIVQQPYYDSLVVNNINAGVNANGSLFSKQLMLPSEFDNASWNSELTPHYRYPKNALTNTIFLSNLWIAGLDENGAIHICAERYNQEGIDLQAGPISITYDTSHYLKYGRTWKISNSEIEFHRQNYWKQGYEPVEAISSWPGNGNPALGEAAQLAPYSDHNNDGFYNCMDGDYPLIRGDETIYFMYNDDIQHTENDGLPLEVEVHGMVFGFNEPADTALYNTVFAHYDIINRSTNTFYNCSLGSFTDIDLGFPTDDFIGCDVGRGTYYGYNGKEIDGNGQYYAYGENPPTQAVTILAGPYMDEDGLDNPAGGCDESINGLNFGNDIPDDERFGMTIFGYFRELPINPYPIYTPPTALDIYLFINGKWRDSTSFTYGGNAHPLYGSVGPDCRFMYPGDSDPLNWGTNCIFPEGGYNQGTRFWTEEETGNNPGDRRGVGSMGPFTFHPGQMQEIDIAYVTGQGNAGVSSSLSQMFRNIDSLRFKVAAGQLVIPSNELGINPGEATGSVIVYPNPASEFITVKSLSAFNDGEYSIFNSLGILKLSGKFSTESKQMINTATLSAGIYIIRVNSGKSITSGKFVKR